MDSSTALAIMKVLRSFATYQRATTIVTLYQTPEPILDLFDKILILYEGQEIFFGSKSSAVAHFTHLGFNRPPKMTTTDFLTALTNPTEAAKLVRLEVKHPPRTAEDFATLWARNNDSKELLDEIHRFEEEHPLEIPRKKSPWSVFTNLFSFISERLISVGLDRHMFYHH